MKQMQHIFLTLGLLVSVRAWSTAGEKLTKDAFAYYTTQFAAGCTVGAVSDHLVKNAPAALTKDYHLKQVNDAFKYTSILYVPDMIQPKKETCEEKGRWAYFAGLLCSHLYLTAHNSAVTK
jgi:hypothetical protein